MCLREGSMLSQALNSFSQVGLVHGDIKPENMFLDYDEKGSIVVKFGDFGGARYLDDPEMKDKIKNGNPNFVQTPTYFSSEDQAAFTFWVDSVTKPNFLNSVKNSYVEYLKKGQINNQTKEHFENTIEFLSKRSGR